MQSMDLVLVLQLILLFAGVVVLAVLAGGSAHKP